jgi:hypothetical protein
MQTGSVVTKQKGEEHIIHLTFGTETVSFERPLRNERHLAQLILVFCIRSLIVDHLKKLLMYTAAHHTNDTSRN